MISIDLRQRVAIVTGAGQGLGAETARRLHAAGASVVVNYFDEGEGRNRALAAQLAGELGERAVALEADVRDPAALARLVGAVLQSWGGIDILVNNAGIVRDRTVSNMSAAEWQAVIDTNLTGVFHACHAVCPYMRDGGRVVSLASISSQHGFFGQANYAAAKAGVVGLTKVLSREWAARGITVNAVAPGVVLTDMALTIPEEQRAAMLAQVPLGRYGEPREVADVILFLCSELASYVTGQTINVNGGWYA